MLLKESQLSSCNGGAVAEESCSSSRWTVFRLWPINRPLTDL